MFKNAGKKLGILLRIWTIFCMVVAGIVGLGFSSVFMFNYRYRNGVILVFLSVFATIIIEFIIWFGSLFMIGLCDMMADVRRIADTVVPKQSKYSNNAPTQYPYGNFNGTPQYQPGSFNATPQNLAGNLNATSQIPTPQDTVSEQN